METKMGATGTGSSDTATLTVRRVVHASVLLDFGGVKILTDPWFSEKGGFPAYHWGEPLGVALGDLPRLSGVVSSHGHYDHFDVEAFAAYPDKAVPFAVKRGTGEKARGVGFENVTELDPWETYSALVFSWASSKVATERARHSINSSRRSANASSDISGARLFFSSGSFRRS